MSLEENQVTAMLFGGGPPEMIETDFIQSRRRGITRDVAAILATHPVCLNDHYHCVPANIGLDASFDGTITRIFGLPAGGNRVHVGGVGAVRQIRAGAARKVDHLIQEKMSALGAMLTED